MSHLLFEFFDPLQILDFTNTNYTITINGTQNLTERGQTTYYGGTSEAAIKVKCEMDNPGQDGTSPDTYYTNSVMNVDNVLLKIKKSSEPESSYELIQGSHYLSMISHGSRIGYDRHPMPKHNNADDITTYYGTFKEGTVPARTGIYPNAYYDQPYDEFIFTKLYTRIHKNSISGENPTRFANIGEEAKYPDGTYDLYASVITVKDDNYPTAIPTTPHKTIIIDNFRPYIQKVEIQSGAIDVYKGQWDWNSANQAIEYIPNGKAYTSNPADGIITQAYRDKEITIVVTSSEPLNELKITDIVPSNQAQALATTYPKVGLPFNAAKTEWWFTLGVPDASSGGFYDGIHNIHFNGTDLSGNLIENFSPSKTSYAASEIPKRVDATTWTPLPNVTQGYDNLHSFEIGIGGNFLNFSINASVTNAVIGEPVVFTPIILESNSKTKSAYSYEWKIKVNQFVLPIQYTTGPLEMTFSENSLITVELTVKQNGEIVGSDLKKDIVNVGDVLDVDIIVDKHIAMVNENILVSAEVSGGSGDYTYSWTFFNDCSQSFSDRESELISYSSTGTKSIDLTVTSGGVSKTVYKTVAISSTPQLSVDFQNGSYDDSYIIQPNDLIQFMSEVKNASGIISYYWDFGDGTNDLTGIHAHPTHTYTSVGEYVVTLRVTANNGSRMVSRRYKVSNVGTINAGFTYTVHPTEPEVTFTVTSNEMVTASLYLGDGSQKICYPSLSFPVTFTHTYQNGGIKEVSMRVVYQSEWVHVSTEDILANGSVAQPSIVISLSETDPVNQPWVASDVLNYKP